MEKQGHGKALWDRFQIFFDNPIRTFDNSAPQQWFGGDILLSLVFVHVFQLSLTWSISCCGSKCARVSIDLEEPQAPSEVHPIVASGLFEVEEPPIDDPKR